MRILFASLGSRGDLNPILALAHEAAARGHEVRVAASGNFSVSVASAGLEFFELRPGLLSAARQVRYLSDARRGPGRLLRECVFPASEATYRDLLAASGGVDMLVVGELLYVAPLVAAQRGIPWLNVILAPSSFLSETDPCVLAPLPVLSRLGRFGKWPTRAVHAIGRRVTGRWAAPLRELERGLGQPAMPNPVYEGKHSPHGVLALFPSFLAAKQPDWPPQTVQTGFPFYDQPAPLPRIVAEFCAAGPPPVVFTLGSAVVMMEDDFYAMAAEAVGTLGCKGILLVGSGHSKPVVSGNLLFANYLPLEEVLPHAVAVVHHGGIGSSAMALRFGKPSLVVPFGYDQPDNAARLERLGVAKVIPRRRLSGSSLAKALAGVLCDRRMAERANALSQRIRPREDLEASVDEIERVGLRREGTFEPCLNP